MRPLLIFVGIATAYIAYSCTTANKEREDRISALHSEKATKLAALEALKTPEQKAIDRERAHKNGVLLTAYHGCVAATERAAIFKDPSSIAWNHEERAIDYDKKQLDAIVRGKNSFGAVVAQRVRCTYEIAGASNARITSVKIIK